MKLTCDCCDIRREFADADEAFRAGWDAPPHFTGYVVCDLCPAAYVVLGQIEKHTPIHERWAREGRPESFSQETCLPEDERVPEEILEAMRAAFQDTEIANPDGSFRSVDLGDPNLNRLVNEKRAAMDQREKRWFWLSFADPDKPAGQQFLGATIVQATNEIMAIEEAHRHSVNPGGAVAIIPLPTDEIGVPPESLRYRLLTKAEAETIAW